MAYWDGTAWVPDTPVTAPLHRGYGTRLLGAAAEGLLIVLLVSGLVAGNALAAKGGGGGKPTGGSDASLVVSPSPVGAYGMEYVVTGSGFKPDTNVNVVISMPACCAFFTVVADGAGDMWFRYQTGDPGLYTVEAHQRLNGKKLSLVAQTTFMVTAP